VEAVLGHVFHLPALQHPAVAHEGDVAGAGPEAPGGLGDLGGDGGEIAGVAGEDFD